MYIFAASDSQRGWERERERGTKRERDFEGVTRQEAILGIGAFD